MTLARPVCPSQILVLLARDASIDAAVASSDHAEERIIGSKRPITATPQPRLRWRHENGEILPVAA
jgi:hypothetical protein